MSAQSQSSAFSGAHILVVGGAGFVGSNLCRALLQHAPERLTIVDNLLSSDVSNIPDAREIEFIEGSIAEGDILAELSDDLEYVFHLATFHGNQNSIYDPLTDHANNTLTTLMLFDHISSFKKLKKVVYASAGCTVAQKTFDEASPSIEDDPVSLYLDSPYQISKIIGEFYANYYFNACRLPAVKARFQNVYGPGEILGAGRWRGTPSTVWRNVVPTFIYKALKNETLPVENEGIATRDFIYVGDIVDGLLQCGAQGAPGEVYNLASGAETSILELAQSINDLTGNSAPIEFLPSRPWDRSGKRYGSVEKARSELGFEVKVAFRDGLERTIKWSRDNLAMIESNINRHAANL